MVLCKQERSPPVIDDFLYVCDDAYTRSELLDMEKQVLKAVDFDIGIPLSYTFLRRYAQVSAAPTKSDDNCRQGSSDSSSLLDLLYVLTASKQLGCIYIDMSTSTGSSKHDFACIPVVAIHIDISSVRVWVTCEFHSYE